MKGGLIMYKKTLGARMTKVDEVFVIIKGNEVFRVNEIGARIFELCNGENDEIKMSEMLRKIYDINIDEINNDIQYFINELLKLELVKQL